MFIRLATRITLLMGYSLDQLKHLFYLNVVFLVLLAIPFIYSSIDTETRIVTLLALIPIGIMFVAIVVLVYVESGTLGS